MARRARSTDAHMEGPLRPDAQRRRGHFVTGLTGGHAADDHRRDGQGVQRFAASAAGGARTG
jgi:hypothetical protein